MDKDFEKHIFTYLEKRHPIKDNVVCFKDDEPYKHIELLFDVDGYMILHDWAVDRIGLCYGVEYPNTTKVWFKDGVYHRLDGPTIIGTDGREEWYKNGHLHRDDGPAIIFPNGTERWYKNGQRHREDGPACIWPDGYQEWWVNGKNTRNNFIEIKSKK